MAPERMMAMSDTRIGSITTVVVAASQSILLCAEPESAVFSQALVTCAGDTLEINVDGFAVLMHRKR